MVSKDHIYVIAPGHELVVENNKLVSFAFSSAIPSSSFGN